MAAILGLLAAGVGGTLWVVRRRQDKVGLDLPEGARLIRPDEQTVRGVPSKVGGAPVDTTIFLEVPVPGDLQALPREELDADAYVGWSVWGTENDDQFEVARRQFVDGEKQRFYIPVIARAPLEVDLDVGFSGRDGRNRDLAQFKIQFR